MDRTQEQHERAVGDKFVDWFNGENHTDFSYSCRPERAPDLTYRDEDRHLNLEIGDAYYDEGDAALLWKNARGVPNAPTSWQGHNFERGLVEHINKVIGCKCRNNYGDGCVLIINVQPALTTGDDMAAMLPAVKVPTRCPFSGVYLTGNFPDSNKGRGGYRCWQIR